MQHNSFLGNLPQLFFGTSWPTLCDISLFPQHEETRSISTTPGWGGSAVQFTHSLATSPALHYDSMTACRYLFKFLGRERHWENEVSCQKMEDMTKPGFELRPLDLQTSTVNVDPFYTLTSVCMFSTLFSIHFLRHWQGGFVCQSKGSFPGDHFLYSHVLSVWFRCDIVGRN